MCFAEFSAFYYKPFIDENDCQPSPLNQCIDHDKELSYPKIIPISGTKNEKMHCRKAKLSCQVLYTKFCLSFS